MNVDASWASTIRSIQTDAAISHEKAEHHFGFFLSALNVYDRRVAERIANEIGLDKSYVNAGLSFSRETDQFLDCIAMKSQTAAQWDFYSYLKQYWQSSVDTDPTLLNVLGHRAGLTDFQNQTVFNSISQNRETGLIRPLQIDTSIVIYGLPKDARITAYGIDKDLRVREKLKVTGNAIDGFRINIFKIEEGDIQVDRIYGYNAAVWRGTYNLHFETPTNSTSAYTTFKNQFNLPNLGGASKFPIGTIRTKYGELFLPKGESLSWAADALTWARTTKFNRFTVSGICSGDFRAISEIKTEYVMAKNRILMSEFYRALDNAYQSHVVKGDAWSTRQIQVALQSAAKLSTLVMSEGVNSLSGPDPYSTPIEKSEAFLKNVQFVLRLRVPKAEARRISEALVSAILSPNFNRLTREAKDGGKDTVKNALAVLQAFDPDAAAVVIKVRLMAEARGRYSDWLPSTKKPINPDDYISYLSRRMLTERGANFSPSNEAVKNLGFTAMAVYIFGALREVAPNIGKIVKSDAERNAILSAIRDCLVEDGNGISYKIPKFKNRVFEQNFDGMIQYGLALHGQFSFTLTKEKRVYLSKRLKILNSRNLWGPAVSLALRSVNLAKGWNVLPSSYKGFIITRMFADVLCVMDYLEHNKKMVKTLAAALKTSVNALETHSNEARQAMSGIAVAARSFSVPQWALRLGDVTARYLAGAPFLRGVAKIGVVALEGVSKVFSLGSDVADILYGTVNIVHGSLEITKGKLRKGIPLTVYGLINTVSGVVFTARGFNLISGSWFSTLRSVSFFLQALATISNIILATVSAVDAQQS